MRQLTHTRLYSHANDEILRSGPAGAEVFWVACPDFWIGA